MSQGALQDEKSRSKAALVIAVRVGLEALLAL